MTTKSKDISCIISKNLKELCHVAAIKSKEINCYALDSSGNSLRDKTQRKWSSIEEIKYVQYYRELLRLLVIKGNNAELFKEKLQEALANGFPIDFYLNAEMEHYKDYSFHPRQLNCDDVGHYPILYDDAGFYNVNYPLLLYAVASYNRDIQTTILLDAGADVNATDVFGVSVLHYACGGRPGAVGGLWGITEETFKRIVAKTKDVNKKMYSIMGGSSAFLCLAKEYIRSRDIDDRDRVNQHIIPKTRILFDAGAEPELPSEDQIKENIRGNFGRRLSPREVQQAQIYRKELETYIAAYQESIRQLSSESSQTVYYDYEI